MSLIDKTLRATLKDWNYKAKIKRLEMTELEQSTLEFDTVAQSVVFLDELIGEMVKSFIVSVSNDLAHLEAAQISDILQDRINYMLERINQQREVRNEID